jgi:hypothetical protein
MLNGRFVVGTRHLTKSLRNYSGRTGLPQELAVPRLAVYFSFAVILLENSSQTLMHEIIPIGYH